MKNYQITQWCARFIREQVQPGDFCIDATMGKGNDTLLLSMLAGPPAGFWPLMFKRGSPPYRETASGGRCSQKLYSSSGLSRKDFLLCFSDP